MFLAYELGGKTKTSPGNSSSRRNSVPLVIEPVRTISSTAAVGITPRELHTFGSVRHQEITTDPLKKNDQKGDPVFFWVGFCGGKNIQTFFWVDFFLKNRWFKGQLGVPLTVYPWYLLCSLGILRNYNPQIQVPTI